MSTTGLRQFDRTIRTTTEWLNDMMAGLGTSDRNKAYLAIRSVVQEAVTEGEIEDELSGLSSKYRQLFGR